MVKLASEIEQKYKEALKGKDVQATSILRLLKSALVNERIAKMHDLSDEEETAVVRREVKKREEASQLYRQGGDEGRANQEAAEADYLKAMLPAEMSEEDIRKIVVDVIKDQGRDNFGKVMGLCMKAVAGQAGGDRVSKVVKEELSKNS